MVKNLIYELAGAEDLSKAGLCPLKGRQHILETGHR
jgi:hypothetical protein